MSTSTETSIIIRECEIWDSALQAHNSIEEFDHWDDKNFQQVIHEETKPHYILVASEENKPVAYLIGYNRWKDGSFYIWMTGVHKEYRRHHLFSQMLQQVTNWAKLNGFVSLKLKTRNNRREMLYFLVKNGWNFIELTPYPNVVDNRLLAMKSLLS
jgi:ribosomal protein S18 acetylase RimI-like enzyme